MTEGSEQLRVFRMSVVRMPKDNEVTNESEKFWRSNYVNNVQKNIAHYHTVQNFTLIETNKKLAEEKKQ